MYASVCIRLDKFQSAGYPELFQWLRPELLDKQSESLAPHLQAD